MVSRFMIQESRQLRNTPTDSCVIATMIFLQQLACCCYLVALCTQVTLNGAFTSHD